MINNPLLSVIVPVYNTGKYLRICLQSIIDSSYKNLEIICIDDGSTDESTEILSKYALQDKRIRVITHQSNQGLFSARISGIKDSKGEYIAFVDSDDYVSCDWFRLLINEAKKSNSDITYGNYVEVINNQKVYSTIPRDYSRVTQTLENKEIYNTFMACRGSYFYFHVMWNKLYKADFFKDNLKWFYNIKPKLIMTEDIAFNCVLLFYAKKISFVGADCYFYCRHENSSTISYTSKEKTMRYLDDVIFVFDFFEKFLKINYIYEEYKKDFNEFKEKYFRIWCNNICAASLDNNTDVVKKLLDGFGQKSMQNSKVYDFHITSLNTAWAEDLENIKKEILSPENKVISFDMFSTLVIRPLWTPTDLFYFVQYKAKNLLPFADENSFYKMRTVSEKVCRQELRSRCEEFEDITLTEIYEKMSLLFNLDPQLTSELMKTEIEVEKELLYVRKTGKELFDLAVESEKYVIVVSDMYLEKSTIQEILNKNNFYPDKIYVSSEYRKLKYTGNLYKKVISDLLINNIINCPDEIMHIGDSWNNDVISPRKYGINAEFLPNPIEVFTDNYSPTFAGGMSKFMYQNQSTSFDTKIIMKQMPIRCIYGIVANEIFDNPFGSFYKNSRYNGNPYIMGVFPLGIYVLSIAKWIYDEATALNYNKIVFLARDGYVIKKVFDLLVSSCNSQLETDYRNITRKSVLPYIADNPFFFYCTDNIVNIYSSDYTYRKYIELFSEVSKPITDEIENEYKKNGINLDDNIGNQEKFYSFIKVYLDISYDKNKKDSDKSLFISKSKEIFTENCATFDIGYSGRIQKYLSSFVNHPVDCFFLHDNGFSTNLIQNNSGFKVFNYTNYTPLITNILREVFISETCPSCIGYEINESDIKIKHGIEINDYSENFSIDLMQKAALNFCKIFISSFKNYLDIMKIRNEEASLAFEDFCMNATEFDKYVFVNHYLDDTTYSGLDKISMVQRWNENINEINSSFSFSHFYTNINFKNNLSYMISDEEALITLTEKKSKIKKAFIYLFLNPKLFWKKLKNKIFHIK